MSITSRLGSFVRNHWSTRRRKARRPSPSRRLLFAEALETRRVLATGVGGGLDPTFDFDGKVTTDFLSTGGERAAAVAIQSDGKIIAAGTEA